jgi:uncharacterized protein YbaP (TraB family)
MNLTQKVRRAVYELESLAITPKVLNELNDDYEMESLVDNIQLNFYQEFNSDRENMHEKNKKYGYEAPQ